MRERWLLFVGLALVIAGIAGMGLSAPADWAWGHHGMTGWWDGDWADGSSPPLEDVSTVVVEATEFEFQPERVSVDAGEPFNLILVNRGGLVHDLFVPDLDVHLAARPGGTITAGIDAAEAGEYRFVCTVPGHAEAGMVGTLVVERT